MYHFCQSPEYIIYIFPFIARISKSGLFSFRTMLERRAFEKIWNKYSHLQNSCCCKFCNISIHVNPQFPLANFELHPLQKILIIYVYIHIYLILESQNHI